MQTNSTHTRNPAFRQGLLFGILLGIFTIVYNVILSFAGLSTLFIGSIMLVYTGSGVLISIVGFIVAILAYLVAGMRATQQTGRVGTGALAGLWTALTGAVITWAYALLFYATAPTIAAPPLPVMALDSILSIALTMLFGAVIGALGGLFRKR
jgi:hypothetical protein